MCVYFRVSVCVFVDSALDTKVEEPSPAVEMSVMTRAIRL